MFYQIFFSTQVEPCAIITYKYSIYELPHELPNGLRQLLFEMIDECKTDHGKFTLPFIKIGKFTMHPMCKVLHQRLNQCN